MEDSNQLYWSNFHYWCLVNSKVCVALFWVKIKKELTKAVCCFKTITSVFKDIVQIAFEVNNPQKVKISILDQSENLITLVYDELSDHGLHVENFDSKKMKDGNYRLELITSNQRILRKIVIKN